MGLAFALALVAVVLLGLLWWIAGLKGLDSFGLSLWGMLAVTAALSGLWLTLHFDQFDRLMLRWTSNWYIPVALLCLELFPMLLIRRAARTGRLYILHRIHEGVILVDRQGRVVHANPAAAQVFGCSVRELREATHERPIWVWLRQFVAPEDRESPPGSRFFEMIHTGVPVQLYQRMIIRRDGSRCTFQAELIPVKNWRGKVTLVYYLLRDITEIVNRQMQMMQRERLDALAMLSGGVAHDLNNLLQVVMGNLELVGLTDPELSRRSEIRESVDGLDRAADLIRQLATFAKGDAPVITGGTDLLTVLKNAVNAGVAGSDVGVHWDLPDHMPPVAIDESQFHQVFIHLTRNAVEAMPEGGMISIRLTLATHHQLATGGWAMSPGEYVHLSFQDEGVGIPAEHLHRIFDPYFTSKPKAQGLGLAISYGIVQRHGGLLAVRSVQDTGTTFDLILPYIQVAGGQKEKDPGTPSVMGQILVLDDDPQVREVVSQNLRHLGYTVAGFEEGGALIRAWHELNRLGTPPLAAFLDVVVTRGMGGVETGKILLRCDPSIKIVLISGYNQMASFCDHGFHGALAKPFRHEELVRLMRTLWESKAAELEPSNRRADPGL